MRPRKLVMENFGPFSGRAEIDFSKLEDIFLICGKTGAGKTTIFDAICFALYGKVPGSRGDHPARLRSDHVPEDGIFGDGDREGGECSVSLEFSVGEKSSRAEKHYLAERSPRQERKKKRGGGTVQAEETLVLYEIHGEKKTVVGSKKSEADSRLKEIIGLEAEEFFKIVLLPQGEFSEFLKQNTSERQKVLAKLFPIEKAERVKELARKKAAEAETFAKGAARRLEGLRQKVSPDTCEKSRADAAAAREAALDKCLRLEKEEAALDRVFVLRRNERDAEKRLEESLTLREEILGTEESMREKTAALSRSREARPLEQYLRGFDAALLAAKTAGADFEGAVREKEAAGKAAAEAERASGTAAALEKECQALREKRPLFSGILEEEEKLKTDEAELKDSEARAEKLNAGIEALSENLKTREIFIEESEALAAEQGALESELELSKSVKNIFMEFRKYRERADNLEKELFLAEKAIRELERRAEETKKRIPVLKAELRRLRDEKIRGEEADIAGRLSPLLEKGKPCPVCGSTEHPRPAVPGEAFFGFDDRIKALEVSVTDAEKNLAGAEAELNAKTGEVLKAREAAGVFEKELREEKLRVFSDPLADYPGNPEVLPYLDTAASLPPRETIDSIIRIEVERLNGILARQKNSRDAAGRIKELYREKTETQNEKADAEKNLAAVREREKNLARQIETGREKHRRLLASVSGSLPAGESQAGGRLSAAEALAALDRSIAEKESLVLRNREDREKALIRLSGAEAALDAAARRRDDNDTAMKKAGAALNEALSAAGFSDPEDAEKALIEPDAEKTLDNEIRLWRENRAGLDTQIDEQKKQLAGIRGELSEILPAEFISAEFQEGSVPSAEEAGKRLQLLKAERAEAEDAKNRAFLALANLDKDREEFLEAQKFYDTLTAESRKYRTLSDDLSGNNPLKLPFDSWLLGNYLEEAAAYATIRLEKMSEYRYSLLLDTERRQGRGYAGLDLQVFDAHTGRTRPCATLSGGESFMASISLALGLADSIQNRSGGVKLDAVFIDEGFGSLDETSLDKALLILDELRDSRMVGLISHVGELRSRVPCQVEVIKTASGSKIKMPE